MDTTETGRQKAGDTGIQHLSTEQRESFLTAVDDIRQQAESMWPSDWQQILALGFQADDTRSYFEERLPTSSKAPAHQQR
jgi:hypothetical protein